MSKAFEEICFDIYKSITPETAKAVIPIVDYFRKLNKKPPIPLREKLCEMKFPTFENKVIMLHGVSVGEVLSLESLINRIKTDFPDFDIVLTTGTKTGFDLANKKYADIVSFITYFPLDIYEACKKFLEKVNPSIVLIAETELWPNFAYACKEKNVPLYIINGRISDDSYPQYQKIRGFIKLILKNYTGVFCQSEIDKDRFTTLGASINDTCVMKNLKFEIDRKICDFDLKTADSKVLIAGSTHPGEEEMILRIYKQLRARIIDLKLIIAPRHLTRLEEVKKLVQKAGFKYGLKSQGATFENNTSVIILDTLGELAKAYGLADIAFIGGSFANVGGHNPLEAVIHGKPVVSGPSIKNFRDIYATLQRAKAAFVLSSEPELYMTLDKLFYNSDHYENTVMHTKACLKDNQGALEFVIDKLKTILNN